MSAADYKYLFHISRRKEFESVVDHRRVHKWQKYFRPFISDGSKSSEETIG